MWLVVLLRSIADAIEHRVVCRGQVCTFCYKPANKRLISGWGQIPYYTCKSCENKPLYLSWERGR